MHIAILMPNSDDSDFALEHPNDGEKWLRLLAKKRPDWVFSTFAVDQGHFPADEQKYDGWIVSASPHSVNHDAPWMPDLFALIRRIATQRRPMLGASFGHQAIAKALGGSVAPNPNGWTFGSTEVVITAPPPWMPAARIWLYASHYEQVTQLPENATTTMSFADCPIGGFVIGDHIFTTQLHPEMSDKFFVALVDHMATSVPSDPVRKAQTSLTRGDDNWVFSNWIIRFFERDFDPNA